jgi:hypothetical protein
MKPATATGTTKGKEVFSRGKLAEEDLLKQRREKEEAAKKARIEAAERGRLASREWAEKQKKRKTMMVVVEKARAEGGKADVGEAVSGSVSAVGTIVWWRNELLVEKEEWRVRWGQSHVRFFEQQYARSQMKWSGSILHAELQVALAYKITGKGVVGQIASASLDGSTAILSEHEDNWLLSNLYLFEASYKAKRAREWRIHQIHWWVMNIRLIDRSGT